MLFHFDESFEVQVTKMLAYFVGAEMSTQINMVSLARIICPTQYQDCKPRVQLLPMRESRTYRKGRFCSKIVVAVNSKAHNGNSVASREYELRLFYVDGQLGRDLDRKILIFFPKNVEIN